MLKTYFTDPGFALSARWALALVFGIAVIHKLKAPAAFVATLKNYHLLPNRLLPVACYLLIALELLTVGSLVANTSIGSGIAAALLSIYTAAIAINLFRGRLDIDCGCSGPAIRQTLSGWLIVRNLGLLAAALLTLQTSASRPLIMLDWFTAIVAVATFALIYSAANHLSAAGVRYSDS